MCKHLAVMVVTLFWTLAASAQTTQPASGREKLLMDNGWRFALGHLTDPDKDFGFGKTYFYGAKAGTSDGPAAGDFDDRAWRVRDLPHDWAVELPFDEHADGGHGYKPVGRGFPATSVGWYRKTFEIPRSDDGRRISIQFDGVFRNATVFVNGFAFGPHRSGYSGFTYDITDVLNYGGTNTIAVRVDASQSEGWFYEGAGIYRHVWLIKTAPLHVAPAGVWVFHTAPEQSGAALVEVSTTISNDTSSPAKFSVGYEVLDDQGTSVTSFRQENIEAAAFAGGFSGVRLQVPKAKLWSLEMPTLYTLLTTVHQNGQVMDRVETKFGVRTLKWDPNEGFFLNGKHVLLKGVCNHQDHAGVGVAVPDALNTWRLLQIKAMGANALRTTHNPPTPEILDACDRLGILVMDETRQTGTDPMALGELASLINRDRNHPSVIIWSLGNEEWGIEGNERGARVVEVMRRLAHQLDWSRLTTHAISGGWGNGTSKSVDVMGFNYFTHGNVDEYHKAHPDQPSVGTEEASTFSTRGIYVEDRANGHLTAYDVNKPDWGSLAHVAMQFHRPRAFVAGMFMWTGFDYRGETTPFSWPAISSQFGILDTCGFFKDNAYYYKAWWDEATPIVHLLPHWDWPGAEGKEIGVWAHSNCDEVELSLNDQSLGRVKVEKYGHAEWKVKYAPGTLVARGFKDGKEVASDRVETTGPAAKVELIADRKTIDANGQDVSVITVRVTDDKGRLVPTAGQSINFAIEGPGKIIGVGNGDPSSHEQDQFVDQIKSIAIGEWKSITVDSTNKRAEVAEQFDDSQWRSAFGGRGGRGAIQSAGIVYRASFEVPADSWTEASKVSLILRDVGQEQWVYVNGREIGHSTEPNPAGHEFNIPPGLHAGKNVIAIVATPLTARGGRRGGGGGGNNAGPAVLRIVNAAGTWKRSVFSGLAQVIVQSDRTAGEIKLIGSSDGLTPANLQLTAKEVQLPPSIP